MNGIFVLGMHRSGTSAVTRMVNLLGVPLCVEEDLMVGYADNPLGHWESESLARFNERLLHLAHAAWDCPPAAEESWLTGPLWSELASARATFEAVHPTRQWAWKDPRLCILVPFWRRALPGDQAAILLLRDPIEVAASVNHRDALAPLQVLAIWERYLRLALTGCRGMPTLVLNYQDLLEHPSNACAAVARFLTDCSLPADSDPRQARAFIRTELYHHRHGGHSRLLTREQRDLLDLAQSMKGVHRPLALVPLPPESPEVTVLIDCLRRSWGYARVARDGGTDARETHSGIGSCYR